MTISLRRIPSSRMWGSVTW